MASGRCRSTSSAARLPPCSNDLEYVRVLIFQDALAQNDKLCELDLSNNHLGAVASASLAKSLLENQTVEVLRLAQNNLYEDVTKGEYKYLCSHFHLSLAPRRQTSFNNLCYFKV